MQSWLSACTVRDHLTSGVQIAIAPLQQLAHTLACARLVRDVIAWLMLPEQARYNALRRPPGMSGRMRKAAHPESERQPE